jgi:RHS repeat-associated protein
MSAITQNSAAFKSFTYDGNGNITTEVRPGETFVTTYNKRNRPVSVTRNTVAYATYGYNALEQLTSRQTSAAGGPVGTVHYIYDLWGHLLAEADAATGATTRDYLWFAANDNTPIDLPLAVAEAAVLYQVHTDHLGRPIRMTDAAKATVWQATWKPWGEAQTISGTKALNLRFPGQYFQIETGYAFNWHRHYDPTTGRYTQPDPLGFVDGPSVYAYAGNSPFTLVDREGRWGKYAAGAALGAAGNVATQLYNNGGNWRCIEIKPVIVAAAAGAIGVKLTSLILGEGTVAASTSTFAAVLANSLSGGLTGGVSSVVTGGDFSSGLVSGGIGGAVGGAFNAPLGSAFGSAGSILGDFIGTIVGEISGVVMTQSSGK